MVALLGPGNILHQHGLYMLHHEVPNSWFVNLRQVSAHYFLPDPLQVLICPPLKQHLKSLVKTAITSFWRASLAAKGKVSPKPLLPTSFFPTTRIWATPGLVDLRFFPQCCKSSNSTSKDVIWTVPFLLASATLD